MVCSPPAGRPTGGAPTFLTSVSVRLSVESPSRARIRRNLPLTTLALVGISGLLVARGHTMASLEWVIHPLNPVSYVASMVIHADRSHFIGNVMLVLPLGVLFTWLTSDRHVLGVAVTANVLTSFVSAWGLRRTGAGLSVVAMALMAAVAVRAVGVATQDADSESFQLAALGLVVPLGGWLFATAVVIGQSPVGHFAHFLGFLFGAAVEGIYVLSEKERERFQEERGQERSMLHER